MAQRVAQLEGTVEGSCELESLLEEQGLGWGFGLLKVNTVGSDFP